jgi:hypothetical protein
MNSILFLSLVIILTAALPWWPYSTYGRLRHHRPWDWLLDTPSREEKLSFLQLAQRSEVLGRGVTPEALQRSATKPCDGAAKESACKIAKAA